MTFWFTRHQTLLCAKDVAKPAFSTRHPRKQHGDRLQTTSRTSPSLGLCYFPALWVRLRKQGLTARVGQINSRNPPWGPFPRKRAYEQCHLQPIIFPHRVHSCRNSACSRTDYRTQFTCITRICMRSHVHNRSKMYILSVYPRKQRRDHHKLRTRARKTLTNNYLSALLITYAPLFSRRKRTRTLLKSYSSKHVQNAFPASRPADCMQSAAR